MRYLLDTNICIYIIKKSPPDVHKRFRTLAVGDVGISAITYYELQFGVAKSQRPAENQLRLTEFLAPLEVFDLPSDAAPVFWRTQGIPSEAGILTTHQPEPHQCQRNVAVYQDNCGQNSNIFFGCMPFCHI